MCYYLQVLYIFFIFYFSSCKKENTKVYGTVNNLADETKLDGFIIYLIERESGFENGGEKTIESTSTDINGRFSFALHTKIWSKYSYKVKIENNEPFEYYFYKFGDQKHIKNFFNINEELEINKKKENNIELRIAPDAFIKIILVNTTPFDVNDTITVWAENTYFSDIIFSNSGIIGKTSNSTYTLSGSMVIKWEVMKNNITAWYSDTIYVAPFESKDYTINY